MQSNTKQQQQRQKLRSFCSVKLLIAIKIVIDSMIFLACKQRSLLLIQLPTTSAHKPPYHTSRCIATVRRNRTFDIAFTQNVIAHKYRRRISTDTSAVAASSTLQEQPSGSLAENTRTDDAVVFRIEEATWRSAVLKHQSRVYELLKDGMTGLDHALNSGARRRRQKNVQSRFTALDPKHPVYNFLIEYYGLKGAKGTKRLARWMPSHQNGLSKCGRSFDGVLLVGANQDDFADRLHLKGASVSSEGVMYSRSSTKYATSLSSDNNREIARLAAPFLWYKSILETTLANEPVLHCHGLHEWAMQYQPPGTEEPPSAKYQAHLQLRVDRSTINAAVERRGVRCTHVDALRFFAPAAAELNHHGSSLTRQDQLRLEQPGCVHAHMDMLKIAMKVIPYISSDLLLDVLEIALVSRRLDVAASPYDCTEYGVGIVPIETSQGRGEYRKRQQDLMQRAKVVRQELLLTYEYFVSTTFGKHILERARTSPAPERFAKAEPGGLPWRKNLISDSTTVRTT